MKSIKLWIIAVVAVAAGGGAFVYTQHQGKTDTEATTSKVSRVSKESKSTSTEQSDSVQSSSSSSASQASQSSAASQTSQKQDSNSATAQPISLDEAQSLLAKVGGEYPSDSQKIISQSGNKTVVGGGIGAKGYDVITFIVDGSQVKIHEVFGTLDNAAHDDQEIPDDGGMGAHASLDMPAKDFVTQR